jgi:hypothetical protein
MMGMPPKDFSVSRSLSLQSSPETKTLLSMTALTLTALRPHRVNLGLNLFG